MFRWFLKVDAKSRGLMTFHIHQKCDGQILIALFLTRKTKKRSSKSDYYWRNYGNFRT